VKDFLYSALEAANIPYDSVAHLISHDEAFVRDNEIYSLCADAGRARLELGWQPRTSFSQLVKMMVEADFAAMSRTVEAASIDHMAA
jgi:GDPmannose 4,6-dehydratase